MEPVYGGSAGAVEGKGFDPRYDMEVRQAQARQQAERILSAERSAKVERNFDGDMATQGTGGPLLYRGEELSLDNIDAAMRYQPWDSQQIDAGDQVRDALTLAAKAILRSVPRSPRRTLALQHLISARMDANAAISFRGRF